MYLLKDFPVLIIDDQINSEGLEGRNLNQLIECLEERGFGVFQSVLSDFQSQWHVNVVDSEVSCITVGWSFNKDQYIQNPTQYIEKETEKITTLIRQFRSRNQVIPIFLMTDKVTLEYLPQSILELIDEYVWKLEDTADFVAGKIARAAGEYLEKLQPPFFKELVKYAEEYKYAWHTPGHMGGLAFRKSAAGRLFYKFFGENLFRADLSVSVPELGSLLDHTGVVKEAEQYAAKTFGADHTFFVTNGTSTANKMVWQGTVSDGDVVLIDRNCHKSLMHSVIQSGAIPLYFKPTRNAYGIIGPIEIDEFSQKTIEDKIRQSPLIPDEKKSTINQIKIATITNSTYDGVCYNVRTIEDRLKRKKDGAGIVQYLHFDEAWYAYARFNRMYDNRYATYDRERAKAYKTIFATQSTHKLLAALSQSAMLHVLDTSGTFNHDLFNEAFMMHTSTSPQYSLIASLDVATKMMEGKFGENAIQEAIEDAVEFRQKLSREKRLQVPSATGQEKPSSGEPDMDGVNPMLQFLEPRATGAQNENTQREDFRFKIWQPDEVAVINKETLSGNSHYWTMKPGGDWHGFNGLEEDYIMLDPIKVTILTPGINVKTRKLNPHGIPAPIISKFLNNKGIVAEKTGFYSFLYLFSIGSTHGKSGTLLAKFLEFTRVYNNDTPLTDVFPTLAQLYRDKEYKNGRKIFTIQDLCDQFHSFLDDPLNFDEEKEEEKTVAKKRNFIEITDSVFNDLPKQVVVPREAYREMINGEVELLNLDEIAAGEKIPSVMVLPYPPGIPVIMPGERFHRNVVDYLKMHEKLDALFPGFETEMHGVEIKNGKYHVYCLKREQ